MAGIDLLKADIFEFLPKAIRESGDTTWRSFATTLNNYRDDAVYLGDESEYSYSIEHLDYIYKPHRIPLPLIRMMAQYFDAVYLDNDSVVNNRRRLATAMEDNFLYGTISTILNGISQISGVEPDIYIKQGGIGGWDEKNDYEAEIGGFLWDEEDHYLVYMQEWIWATQSQGIFIDLKYEEAHFTAEELEAIYTIIGENKNADAIVRVGWVDGGGAEVTFTTIYYRDIDEPLVTPIADPGL